MNMSILFDLASLSQPEAQILLYQKERCFFSLHCAFASPDNLLSSNYADIKMFREQQRKICNLSQALVLQLPYATGQLGYFLLKVPLLLH